jgi:hypothetical protein
MIDDQRLEDQVLDQVGCTKAEWVQWITDNAKNGNFIGVWGTVRDDRIERYIVAVNGVYPPLSRAVLILYQNFFGETDEDAHPLFDRALACVDEWAEILGANRITGVTKYPRIMGKYGFEREGIAITKHI